MEPDLYYTKRIAHFQNKLRTVVSRARFIGLMRLFVFLLSIYLIYILREQPLYWVSVTLIGGALFLWLVKIHLNLKYEKQKNKAFIEINETELKVLQGDYYSLPDGREFTDPSHPFSHDIDLFGRASFFQYLNRTVTAAGKKTLAELLSCNSTDTIHKRQEAVKELSEASDWRQDFMATAGIIKSEVAETSILSWIGNYQPAIKTGLLTLPLVFSFFSLVLIVLSVFSVISSDLLIWWFIAGLLISGFFFRRINILSENTSKVRDTFQQYHKLLELIVHKDFNAGLLRSKQETLKESPEALGALKSFSGLLDALDQRNNMIAGVLGNGFFLMDLYNAIRIEKWLQKHAVYTAKWFDIVGDLDALISLGGFAFNHPYYVYPVLTGKEKVIVTEGLGHPLIASEKMVTNDFNIDTSNFYVITGANMAGKSTFLRTVSLSLVMANCGLPVCARSYRYHPVKLITSMRTSDSLSDEASYFYAELTRLKSITEQIKNDEYFIVLDEILKGTNSKDKARGSKKFVEKLAASGSTGIIATHDLSLCELAKTEPRIENYFFDAYIKKDELYFDYTLKKGICTNMNASFLLNKMGIV